MDPGGAGARFALLLEKPPRPELKAVAMKPPSKPLEYVLLMSMVDY